MVLLVPLGAVVGILAYQATGSNATGVTVLQSEAARSAALLPTLVTSPAAGNGQDRQALGPRGSPAAGEAGGAAQATVPPAATGATAAPTTVVSPMPQAAAASGTPAANAARLLVVNAAPDGVRLRSEPGDGDPLTVLADGTEVEGLKESREISGRTWMLVREPEGLQGWVAADFLAAVEPTATPTTVARTATATVPPAPPQTPRPQPTTPPAATAPPATAAPTMTAARSTQATATPAAAAPPPAPAPTPSVAAAAPTQAAAAPTVAPPVKPSAPGSGSGGGGRAAPRGTDCPSSHPIKGNHSASGEWIYHPPRGQFYSRTHPEDCFATEADARAAGYRASMR